jgi:hypothetical protein
VPLLLTVLALNAIFIVNAGMTGRLGAWGPWIVGLPLIGALLYVVMELIPDCLDEDEVRQICCEAVRTVRATA